MRNLIFLLLIVIAGCSPLAKVPGKLNKLNEKHPGAVARWVAKEYPCSTINSDTTVITDTLVIECEGTEIPFVFEEGNSVETNNKINTANKNKVVLKPGQSIPITTRTITITKYIKSNADSIVAEKKLLDLQQKHDSQKNKTKWWQGVAIAEGILFIIILLLLFALLKKRLK